MSADPWEPWLTELEGACDAGDGGRARTILEDIWRFPFHAERARASERWDRLFALLLRLLGYGDARIRDLAYHYARIAMGSQLGPSWGEHTAEDRVRLVARRTAELLPALAPLVRGGAMSLLRCTDDLVHVEGLADLGPQQIYREWIASFADDAALALAARIAYLDGRGSWESAGESLLGCLDHADSMVRAYTARALGQRYLDHAAEPEPPLCEVVAMLTAKEIARPGIAGPFFSNWYAFGIEEFERHGGVKVEDWFCTILAQRRQPEPDTLPCSNGIDFFAHEVFGGRPGYVRRLLDMGHEELAVQAATEVNDRIDGMEPLLVELGDRADAEVCRLAAWHLASHYRFLHAAGERRGFVRKRTLAGGAAELFVNLSPRPGLDSYAYAAVLYPPPGDTFDAAAAAACLELVLPESMRGDLLPYGIPGDGGKPGLYLHGRSASARYRCGALVELRGDVGAQRWEWIRILWHGPPGAWRPEVAG
jgi:hypothetical protein